MDKPGATAWQEVSFTISRKLDLLFVLLSHEVSILTAKLGIYSAAWQQRLGDLNCVHKSMKRRPASHEVSILTAKLGICLAALAQNASVTPLNILLLL